MIADAAEPGPDGRRPLEGLRVVDCSRGRAGTRATGFLADYGADVTWVEPPGGDPYRSVLRREYAVFNRGKRSVVLDFEDPEDRQRLGDLLAVADVFFTSWRPGVAERHGLDQVSLRAQYPGLVHCSITGFGPAFDEPDLAGYDPVVHALVGTFADQVGHREGPVYQALPFGSIGAAYLAVIGALAALYRRLEDGQGRSVETSVLDGALAYLSMWWGDTDDAGQRPPPVAGARRLVARTFRCGDGEYLGVHTGAVGAFDRLMRVLGLGEAFPGGDGLNMGAPLSADQIDLMRDRVPAIFETRPRKEWLELLLAADVCAVPELRAGEAFDEPQVRHNRLVARTDDPVLGPIEQIAPPTAIPGVRPWEALRAPRAGEHSSEPLAEVGTDPSWCGIGSPARVPQTLLAGVKILDLGAYFAGPYASRLLADLGADVIKLETVQGDQLRGLPGAFRACQAGKRGLAVNLKDPEMQVVLHHLIRWADVISHNLRPGAADRLGIGPDDVKLIDRGTSYHYAPGWGSSGPDMLRQSFAPLLSGYAGVGFEVAGAYNEPLFPLGNEDPGNGLVGAASILMALLHQRRTGDGLYVETPQLNATLNHLADVVRQPDGTVLGADRLDPLQTGLGPFDRLYPTRDGWICLCAYSAREVAAVVAALGIDPPFGPDAHELVWSDDDGYRASQLIESVLQDLSTSEAVAALRRAGVAAVEPVGQNNVAFMRDPGNRATGRVAVVDHEIHGHVREIATLIRVSEALVPEHRLAPDLGADTESILAQFGVSTEQLSGWKTCRTIVQPGPEAPI